MDESTVGKWTRGDLEPNLDGLGALSRALDRTIDWLLGLDRPGDPTEMRREYERELAEAKRLRAASARQLRALLSTLEADHKP